MRFQGPVGIYQFFSFYLIVIGLQFSWGLQQSLPLMTQNAGNWLIYRFFQRRYTSNEQREGLLLRGRCWSPWSHSRAPPALHDTGSVPDQGFSDWPLQNRQMCLNRLKHRGIISEMREGAISACDTVGLISDLLSLLLNTKRSLWEGSECSDCISTFISSAKVMYQRC